LYSGALTILDSAAFDGRKAGEGARDGQPAGETAVRTASYLLTS
jgi:hypothetical protein